MHLEIRDEVKKNYGAIAGRVLKEESTSCGCRKGSKYKPEEIKGLPIDAINASLGCSNPMSFANLKEGEIVLDLGCGGGIDCFIASKYVGPNGMVYGVDMTDEMLELAIRNKEKTGIENVQFIKGYIEEIPLEDGLVEVVLSNCVINLSPNKEKTLSEAYRVLKNGGRFAVADIVACKELPDSITQNTSGWAACMTGAIHMDEYRKTLERVGFKDVKIELAGYIQGFAGQDYFSDEDLRIMLDKAYASAHITAIK